VRDIVALANSGGGVILFGVTRSGDPSNFDLSSVAALPVAKIVRELERYVDTPFNDVEIVDTTRDSQRVVALVVGEAMAPLVFSSGSGAFAAGTLFFRHGAKSGPATSGDMAAALDRRLNAVRKSWLGAVKRAVERPEVTNVTPIRVVQDPHAPVVGLVDYDKTHPYRQKELLAEFRRRFAGRPINQFDLQAVRFAHRVDVNPDFSHKSLYGSKQYSDRFLEWLLDRASSDPQFFEEARETYMRARRPD
jgi:hypothetical protein